MVSPERSEAATARSSSAEVVMAEPRISFSADFLDDDSFISISPNSSLEKEQEIDAQIELELAAAAKNNPEFEFLSTKNSFDGTQTMLTADELFFEGKLLPFSQIHHAAEKLSKISLKSDDRKPNSTPGSKEKRVDGTNSTNASAILLGREPSEPRIWFVDDDPSPRPPKCTVLWKELLRLRKNPRNSTLSPSSSSSSSSSSASSLGEAAAMEEREKSSSTREKHIKRVKKGLERTRSATIRIRPMVNVPLCTQNKSSSLPPLFPLRKPRIDR